MALRELPPGAYESTQTPEFHARMAADVAELGQRRLALAFLPPEFEDDGAPLTAIHMKVLTKNAGPLDADWETWPSVWQHGDEECFAYGLLTLRQLMQFEVRTYSSGSKCIVAYLTPSGRAALAR